MLRPSKCRSDRIPRREIRARLPKPKLYPFGAADGRAMSANGKYYLAQGRKINPVVPIAH